MKHKFSRAVSFIPEWQNNRGLAPNDQIKTLITPLKVAELLDLMDALGGAKITTDAAALADNTDLTKVVQQCGHLLPKHITLSGLEDDDGAVSIEDVVMYPAYLGLAAELIMQCAAVSMPSESAEGNSAKPPA
jgi:hypothetical protein